MACHSDSIVEQSDFQENCCQQSGISSPSHFLPAEGLKKENPILKPALEKSDTAYNLVTQSTPNTIQCVTSSSDFDQRKNTEHLEERAKDVATWQGEIQALISKLREEITLLDCLRKRVECSLTALQTPEAINEECIARRTCRIGHDLISDEVDATLDQEKRLCKDVRDVHTLTLAEIESQLKTNTVCKVQLEFDWSDKNEAYRLEVINIGLRKKGPISFFPGATRLQEHQSTPDHWLHYTKEQVAQGRAVLQRSANLRRRTEEALSQAAADLRAQANAVEMSLQQNVATTERALQKAEEELTHVLNQITTAETLHAKLAHLLRQVDLNVKVVQTRLTHRAARPRAENTRDCIQFGLISEVTHLNEDAVRLKQEMEAADSTLQSLYNSRAILEDTIVVKRKSLYIDRNRCLFHRAKFLDSTTLSGF